MKDLKLKILDSSFTYNDFIKSSTATRKGILNIPNDEQWKNIELLVENIILPIETNFCKIRITSGFRSIALCEAIGSDKNSNHAKGQAVDIEPIDPKIRLFDLLDYIHTNLEYRELIAEYFPDGWVHVAYRQNENIKVLKLKDKNNNYTKVYIDSLRSLYG